MLETPSLEPLVRIELTTYSLRVNCSTPEPQRQVANIIIAMDFRFVNYQCLFCLTSTGPDLKNPTSSNRR